MSAKRVLEPGSVWRHYKKGTTYEIIGIASSQVDENESDMVVYQALDSDGTLAVRPVNKFLEKVNPTTNRFDRVDDGNAAARGGFCQYLSLLFGCSSSGVTKIDNGKILIVVQSSQANRHLQQTTSSSPPTTNKTTGATAASSSKSSPIAKELVVVTEDEEFEVEA